ncbi:MAG TPA: ATP-binding cassette domain-containing protein [Acidobacteriaceae bacterium]|nr:ATP-binding cassette domain-containing protein [Acidobacteriaceae bacterium]
MTTRSCMSIAPPRAWHHRLDLDCTLGSLHLDLAPLEFAAPWSILFGPSGSGKSSVLRAICGLLPHAHPTLLRSSEDHENNLTHLPPHGRSIAYAPQQPALFPHLTVRDNIAFSSSLHPPANPQLAEDALALFELHPIAHRTPARLSGGERQRVNLARAFARPNTRLMLLDEPFTGLDIKLRDQLIPRMKQFLAARSIPCISVTHDVDEALLLDAEVFRIDAGRILAFGPARIILADERARLLNALR